MLLLTAAGAHLAWLGPFRHCQGEGSVHLRFLATDSQRGANLSLGRLLVLLPKRLSLVISPHINTCLEQTF